MGGTVTLTVNNDVVLEEDMIFVVHPNQYIPETGYLLCGEPVRVTATGVETLTTRTAAPPTFAPEASTTDPLMEPPTTCARSATGRVSNNGRNAIRSERIRNDMKSPWTGCSFSCIAQSQ